MEITTTVEQGINIITLSGRFDTTAISTFKMYLERFTSLRDQTPDFFVIDMAGVEYIDSGGLGTLVSFVRRVRQQGGDVKIARLSERARNVFELTRLHRVFEIFDDCLKGVASYSTSKTQEVDNGMHRTKTPANF